MLEQLGVSLGDAVPDVEPLTERAGEGDAVREGVAEMGGGEYSPGPSESPSDTKYTMDGRLETSGDTPL